MGISAHSESKIRSPNKGGWYWISRTILEVYGQQLKASGIAVYNVLAAFSNSKTQSCFPGQKAIARLIGVSRRTVIRKIKLLESLGLIKVERKTGSLTYSLLGVMVVTKKTEDVTNGIQEV